ncbi:hypothetical protein FEM41_11460 [Jejubacter calystegiae]|uniref:DUF1240 domain-containing protein n=1 Tax=Jejubacter calystegiae TaxID=2579935 RepID=A0A4P8YNN7_9ENTR|nr:hypothetical protein [Jejubacter calystegiae]QCT20222.1 hypothetical protein FEM41_11460 [Jejubacter calystegiae]
MNKLTLRERLSAAFVLLSTLLIPGICTYFSLNDIAVYFSYPKTLTFSYFTIFSLLSFIIFLPITSLSIHPVFRGKKSSNNFQKKVGVTMLVAAILITTTTIIFNAFYLNRISAKGYVACKGIPVGWMPGMAKKYAINESLCHK